MKSIRTIVLVCLATASSLCAAEPDFAKDVAPILNKYCVGCHSEKEAEGDLRLDTYELLKKGGENGSLINAKALSKSLLIARITDTDDPMPPKDEPRPSKEEIAKLISWVNAGAKRPTGKIDPKVVKFDKLKPTKKTKSVSAIAYRPGGNIIVRGKLMITGVDIVSAKGLLVPDAEAEATPFTFHLSNTPNQITAATLGTEVKLDGELRMKARYPGSDPAGDLTVNIGVGPEPKEADYRFEEAVAVGRFGFVELYDEASETPMVSLNTPGKVHEIRFSKDGEHFLAASGVGGLRGEAILCSTYDGKVFQTFKGHIDSIYTAAISDDNKYVATGSYDKKIIIWSVESGEKLRTLSGHNGAIYDLDFSPDGKVLVSASADATVKVWNVKTGVRLDTLGQPLKEQYAVDFSRDGKSIIAAGEDNRIRMWELKSIDKPEINRLLKARFAHEGAIEQLRYSGDGKFVVSSSSDGTVKVWDAKDLSLLNSFNKTADCTEAFALSMDSKRISIGKNDGTLKAFPLQASEETRTSKPKPVKLSKTRNVRENKDYKESEPNDHPLKAQFVSLPATIAGRIHAYDIGSGKKIRKDKTDKDLYQFRVSAGEKWIFEVKAARDESPLDSHIEILDSAGKSVPRVQLQATRDSYFTFRGKNSNETGDFRMHNWEEMKLNQLLYSSGEVVKLYHYPRGPDSGFNVYPNFGNRRGYFDTTPIVHALHEPAYIVEAHPPGAKLPPNGLPVFQLNFENDDDSQRRLGKDSRLTFVAPEDGDYFLALRDVRSQQGEDFKYSLIVRAPKPDFKGKLLDKELKAVPGAGKKFSLEVERIDDFAGPIDVSIKGLPKGFSVPGPLQFESDHDRISATLLVEEDGKTLSEEQLQKVKFQLSAKINGVTVQHEVEPFGKVEVEEKAKLLVQLIPDHKPTKGSGDYPVVELKPGQSTTATIKITRNDHDGRVGFGKESGAWNAPHGVYIDNIGLNGVLIVEGQNERQFFITAEPWVKPMERVIFVEAEDAGKPTSNPALLRILPTDKPKVAEQAAR